MTQLPFESAGKTVDRLLEPASVGKRNVLNEESFNRMIAIERKRTERSKQPFLLMLLEDGRDQSSQRDSGPLDSIVSALLPTIRETDVIGWYKDRKAVGVMYTGLMVNEKTAVLNMIQGRVSATLRDSVASDQFSHVRISFHFFPDDWDDDGSGRPSNAALYPDLLSSSNNRRSVLIIKRGMDIAGSALMLFLCAPIFVAHRAGDQSVIQRSGVFQTAAGRTVRSAVHIS